MRRIIRYIAAGLLPAIAFSSCLSDTYLGDNPSEDTTIVLTLKMPYAVSTRAISEADESKIETVDILALTKLNIAGSEYWAFDYMATEIAREISGNTMTVTARVREMTSEQQFVVLVNCSAELIATAPVRYEKIGEIEERLICSTGEGEWPVDDGAFAPFPMYARTHAQVVNTTNNSIGIYPMIRMVAGIDVTLDGAVGNFVLEEACLFNYKTAGYISYGFSDFVETPLPAAVTTPAVPALGNPAGNAILQTVYYPAVVSVTHPRGAVEKSIYTFESEAITAGADRTKKTALVIGGYYNGSPAKSYYRIDLKTADDASDNISSGILRNHRYAVVVQSVAGPGYDRDIDAYLGSSRLTAKIVSWTDIDQKTIADGQYLLTVNMDGDSELPKAGGTLTIQAKTNYNTILQGFPEGIWIDASKIEYIPEVALGDEWLTLDDVSGTDGDLVRTVGVTASNNAAGADRVAKIKIVAGNLTQVVHVTQYGGAVWAGSNIYWSNGTLTFDDVNDHSHEQYQGVYFKWGSLWGISPAGPWTNNSTVVYRPVAGGYTPSTSPTWGEIPYCNPGDIPADRNSRYLTETAHTAANVANGIGDICKYLTDQAPGGTLHGKKWRMPASIEFNSVVPSESSLSALSQTHTDYVWLLAGTAETANAAGTALFPRGVRKSKAVGTPFFPVAGYRNAADGEWRFADDSADVSSSSPRISSQYCMNFNVWPMFDDLYTASYASRAYGFSVRCVRE